MDQDTRTQQIKDVLLLVLTLARLSLVSTSLLLPAVGKSNEKLELTMR
jgi:hypothetical protein